MTAKDARKKLQKIVTGFLHIDYQEVHRLAREYMDMDTARSIARENDQKADAFVMLVGEFLTHHYSMVMLLSTVDAVVLFSFAYRYLIVLQHLATIPPETNLFLYYEDDRFLEQTLIELYKKVEGTVYSEIQALHPKHKVSL
jgi:hypothetical protein